MGGARNAEQKGRKDRELVRLGIRKKQRGPGSKRHLLQESAKVWNQTTTAEGGETRVAPDWEKKRGGRGRNLKCKGRSESQEKTNSAERRESGGT